MRAIKFRAKPDMGYFLASEDVEIKDGFVYGVPDVRMLDVPGADVWRKGHRDVDMPSIVACTRDGWPRSVAVDGNTIGQFTTLRDKNGREIYEGDILKCGDEKTLLEVRFVRGVFAFLWNGDLDDEFPCNAPTQEWAEVVGNIHDNPTMIRKR